MAYLECFAGIAGDMFLGALVDAGVRPALLQAAADSLHLNVTLAFEKADRSGVQATRARVLVQGVDAELASASGGGPAHASGAEEAGMVDGHVHHSGHDHHHGHEHGEAHTHTDAHGVAHTHAHSHSHDHPHEHATVPHVHGRGLVQIRQLIEHAAITARARRIALDTFERLGAAEAKVHGMPVEEVHFHEVGAVDAIIDIVCGAVGADALGVDAWYCSAVNTGSGFVDCAHGRFPVPAPATLELLHGVPVYAEGPAKEMTTPTGAALLAALGCRYEALPAFTADAAGYGAGTRNPEKFANVLRLRTGVIDRTAPDDEKDTVTVLTCAVDDATPEMLAHAAQLLLDQGALDVMQQAAVMKKGRHGTLLTVLCRPENAVLLEDLLLRETTTLGVRIRQEQRSILERSSVQVETSYGVVGVKLGMRAGAVLNAAAEFEDCSRAAAAHGVALKLVMQAAMAAYADQGVKAR